MMEAGYELDTLSPRPGAVRWWLYLFLQQGRRQEPRKGVMDPGFRFARGGRADTTEEAEEALEEARAQARVEWQSWVHQPSHRLAENGDLIPLMPTLPELES